MIKASLTNAITLAQIDAEAPVLEITKLFPSRTTTILLPWVETSGIPRPLGLYSPLLSVLMPDTYADAAAA